MSSRERTHFRDRAREELARGRPWRAKEILRGNIGNRPYDTETYLLYGEVLCLMGEIVEAGKFLLLAGSEAPEHRDAIDAFVRRFGRPGRRMERHFPPPARGLALEDYPATVRRALEQVEPDAAAEARTRRTHRQRRREDRATASVLWGLFGGAVFLMVVGIVQMLRWAIRLAAP